MSTSPPPPRGLGIRQTAHLFRNYNHVERASIKILTGWFLAAPAWEIKYRLAYHVIDHAEHVTAYRNRLLEMRGGQPDSAVAQPLRHLMAEALHAPSTDSLLRGLYGVIKRDLLRALQNHQAVLDPAANAVEDRMLRKIIPDLEAQMVCQ